MHKRTYQIQIKQGHKLYDYLKTMCENSKNMYNVTNFYIRQIYTGITSEKTLHPLQQEVLDTITKNFDKINDAQLAAYKKKVDKQPTQEKKQQVKCNLFKKPTKENPYVNYNFLDALFKIIGQNDYRSLPTQNSQSIMKQVFQDWKSFFKALADYKKHPDKYKARPNIPGYAKESQKTAIFTNQDCVVKDEKYLKFPKSTVNLNIGKLGIKGKLKQVRVVPKYSGYIVELVMDVPEQELVNSHDQHFMSIDLGIDNLATLVTNTGMSPVLIKGTHIKSMNAYYNKLRAHYYSILRLGKNSKDGSFTSKRLEKMSQKRYNKIKDLFHKASFRIVKIAMEQKIKTIFIGKNQDWKQNANIGSVNNQNFVQIPHTLLTKMIAYKAGEVGIDVQFVDESYTSKASFLDLDPIPTYQKGQKNEAEFSGKRVKRGLYQTKNGILINADVNGAANILRKALSKATANGIQGLSGLVSLNVLTPTALLVR